MMTSHAGHETVLVTVQPMPRSDVLSKAGEDCPVCAIVIAITLYFLPGDFDFRCRGQTEQICCVIAPRTTNVERPSMVLS